MKKGSPFWKPFFWWSWTVSPEYAANIDARPGADPGKFPDRSTGTGLERPKKRSKKDPKMPKRKKGALPGLSGKQSPRHDLSVGLPSELQPHNQTNYLTRENYPDIFPSK
jgi:hypothetical protein